MTKEQEAQQAQTVKRIGEMLNTPWGHDVGVWVNNCEDLREIVDSQAQKIAEQAQTIAINAAYAIELQGKIAEQAKRILELEIEAAEHVCSLDNNGR